MHLTTELQQYREMTPFATVDDHGSSGDQYSKLYFCALSSIPSFLTAQITLDPWSVEYLPNPARFLKNSGKNIYSFCRPTK